MNLIQKFNFKYDKKDSRKTIGLAGFFGYGNFGDELFLDVYAQFLADDYNLKIMHDELDPPYFSESAKKAVDRVDAIIIGGGDIVQPWGFDPRYFNFEYLSKPVFVVGVGVPIRAKSKLTNPNHIEKDWIVEKYRKFFGHASVKFIHARDSESQLWIEERIKDSVKLTVGPDIVCSLDIPKKTADKHHKVLGIITRSRPGKENIDNFSQIMKVCEKFHDKGWKINHIILGVGPVFSKDLSSSVRLNFLHKNLIIGDNTNDLCNEISKCDLLMSMKFHGTVVATMCGIPSVVLVPTSKNRNFMRRINREDLLSSFESLTLSDFSEKIPSDISQDDVIRLKRDSSAVMENLRKALQCEI